MSIVLNGTTGVTTPDVTSDSYTGALAVDASAPDDSLVVDASGRLLVGATSVTGTAVQPKLYIGNAQNDGTEGLQIVSYKPSIVLSDISTGYYNYQIATDAGSFRVGYESGTIGSTNTFTERLRIEAGSGTRRFLISSAAFLVKVSPSIASGGIP